MTIRLDSIETAPAVSEQVSNGTWAAAVNLGRTFDGTIPGWNGCHDGQTWTAEQCKKMADYLQATAQVMVPILRDLAEHGGVKIS